MKNVLLLIGLIVIGSCGSGSDDPRAIVDEAIKAAGGDHYNQVEIEFTFRDRDYGAKFKDGYFEYVRLFKDSAKVYRDVLTNDGFHREINGKKVEIPDSMAAKYANSVNSVIYFALLPKGLNDPAVNKEYLGTKQIKGQDYHKIKITFDQKGGGKDFNDEFVYWINKKNQHVDYLAYKYHTDGGGMRFREAYNARTVGGIRFVDYVNYKPKEDVALLNIDDAFMNGKLEELSRIDLENLKVTQI